MHVLDNPTWSALTGSQRDLGSATSLAARYDPEVAVFGAFPAQPDEAHWQAMAELIGPGGSVALCGGPSRPPPPGWTVVMDLAGLQMVGDPDALRGGSSEPTGPIAGTQRMEPLGNDDVPEMLELVAAAQPGPFLSRTVEFGGYVGVRHEGRLIAMAGERMRPDGHAEISAVATHPAHRRQGLGESLVRTVAAGILGRGEIPFLHVATDNSRAIALYERLGFTVRREVAILVVEAPTA